jgi:hypothetical protein
MSETICKNICKCCNLPRGIFCKKCGDEQPAENFHKGRKICKDCRKVDNQERYLKNKLLKQNIINDAEIINEVNNVE